MSSFWNDQKVIVTGGSGFLGRQVVKILKRKGCKTIFVPRSSEFDLCYESPIKRMYSMVKPTMVIHLAAVIGGIGANQRHPGKFFYKNAIMGIQLMEYAREFNVKKFVAVGTICAYPKHTRVPFKEDDLWAGYPEETNAPYGLAKKMILVQSQAYRDEYGFNSIFLLPVNLYGPGDNFDLENSHVIPALIRKFHTATFLKQPEVVLWGDGSATREFLYVDDAATGIVLAAQHYNRREPVNLGAGFEIKIKKLAELVKRKIGFKGRIVWDTSKPNGQPRRCLDVSRAKKEFGFVAKTKLEDGLKRTIEWYLRHYLEIQRKNR